MMRKRKWQYCTMCRISIHGTTSHVKPNYLSCLPDYAVIHRLLIMELFSPDTEADALKLIEKINAEMRAISALVHLNYDMIDGRNRNKIRTHFCNIVRYGKKYDKI